MDPIVRLAASALPDEKKFVLFAGAGVSKDAGVPTAWDIMLATARLLYAAEMHSQQKDTDSAANLTDAKLEEWFTNSNYARMAYADLIGQLYPLSPDQQTFLEGQLGEKKIGDSHKGIAALAKKGIIRAIVTTNFDPYIEDALREAGLKFQVTSTDEDIEASEPLIQCRRVRVYKPHGTLGRGKLKNTPRDLSELTPLMHQELVRVLSEHGVMVLGYSGSDEGIQRVFEERRYTQYPLFWINRRPPEGKIADILGTKDYTFLRCVGASQFIGDFLHLQSRLQDMTAVTTRSRVTLADLQSALRPETEPVAKPLGDYLSSIVTDMKRIQSDATAARHTPSDFDETIVQQIGEGLPLSRRFLEAALLASRYNNTEAIKALYQFFGDALQFANSPHMPPAEISSDFDSDAVRFLIYEMFVGFVAILMRDNNWEQLGQLLEEKVYVQKEYAGSGYVSYRHINLPVRSIDSLRNARLKSKRLSLVSDMLNERISRGALSGLIAWQEFTDADHFLFAHSMCRIQREKPPWNVWCPKSGYYFKKLPDYILRGQDASYGDRVATALGRVSFHDFIQLIKQEHNKAIVLCLGSQGSDLFRMQFDYDLDFAYPDLELE